MIDNLRKFVIYLEKINEMALTFQKEREKRSCYYSKTLIEMDATFANYSIPIFGIEMGQKQQKKPLFDRNLLIV